MNRLLLLFVLMGPLAIANLRAAEPLGHETADAAQEAYGAAIAKAQADYIVKLGEAVKEAGAAGQLEIATRIADEKKRIEAESKGEPTDPIDIATREIEGSVWVWGAGKSASRISFSKNGKATNPNGAKMTWTMADPTTLLIQSHETSNIYVCRFDEKLRTATVYTFAKSGSYVSAKRTR